MYLSLPLAGRARTLTALGALAAVASACAPADRPTEDKGGEAAAEAQATTLVIQAEDYNPGGEGVGYSDTTPGNTGGQYRQDDVDIQTTTDTGGGYCVGWVAPGEWLAYTFPAPASTTYQFSVRVASHATGAKTVHLEVDGKALASVGYNDASGWQVWNTLSLGGVALPAGTHALKLVSENGGINFNYIEIAYPPTNSPMALVLPAQGALYGYYGTGNSIPYVQAIEASMGRKVDVVKRYHDFSNLGGNGVFPSADEKALADAGRVLHFAWETTIYGTIAAGMPPYEGADKTYTYDQITSGQLDPYIDATAARFKAYGHPAFIDFDPEADDSTALGGSNASRASAGTPAQFAAAYRYVVNRFRADGVTNAIWAVAFSGFQSNDAIYRELYPGDDVVDMIGNDPYNHTPATSWTLPASLFARFYDRLEAGLLGATAAQKPRMLAEYGCTADVQTPSRRPDWMRAIPDALKGLPKLKVVEYFDSGEGLFRGDAGSTQGFVDASHDAWVNQPHND